jgi:hypothetical protein
LVESLHPKPRGRDTHGKNNRDVICLALVSRNTTPNTPWGDNPFPEGTPQHQSWKEMNLWTKEHLAMLHAEILESMPPGGASPKEFLAHRLKALAGVFDTWVRAVSLDVVPTDEAADIFEQFLNVFESAMVALAIGLPPTSVPEGLYTTEVEILLKQRKQYWLGRMLKRVREHKEANSAKTAASTRVDVVSSEAELRMPPQSADDNAAPGILSPRCGPHEAKEEAVRETGGAESVEERAERRSAVVMPILKSKRWTRAKWASKAGVGKNGVYDYLGGKRNLSFENHRALAEVLKLKPEELPD